MSGEALLLELNRGLAQAVERARAGLVRVESGRRGAGAGAVWHAEGLILTNAHVAGRGRARVRLSDGRLLEARLLGRDERLDLAALAVEASGLPAIELGSSGLLRPGEIVAAVGHPWGVEGAATFGVVIGVGVGLPGLPADGRAMLAAGLHLRPGHSGGALVDAAGRLVGINTLAAGPDLGLAVPVDVAKRFAREVFARPLRRAA